MGLFIQNNSNLFRSIANSMELELRVRMYADLIQLEESEDGGMEWVCFGELFEWYEQYDKSKVHATRTPYALSAEELRQWKRRMIKNGCSIHSFSSKDNKFAFRPIRNELNKDELHIVDRVVERYGTRHYPAIFHIALIDPRRVFKMENSNEIPLHEITVKILTQQPIEEVEKQIRNALFGLVDISELKIEEVEN